jgi:hypothetical protein
MLCKGPHSWSWNITALILLALSALVIVPARAAARDGDPSDFAEQREWRQETQSQGKELEVQHETSLESSGGESSDSQHESEVDAPLPDPPDLHMPTPDEDPCFYEPCIRAADPSDYDRYVPEPEWVGPPEPGDEYEDWFEVLYREPEWQLIEIMEVE